MSKALDRVDHSILVSKLEGYGVDPVGMNFLLDRLLTRVGCSKSTLFSLSSGVNQGSLLGPCLFNIFTNDLLEVVFVNTLQFANDLPHMKILKDCNYAFPQLWIGVLGTACL